MIPPERPAICHGSPGRGSRPTETRAGRRAPSRCRCRFPDVAAATSSARVAVSEPKTATLAEPTSLPCAAKRQRGSQSRTRREQERLLVSSRKSTLPVAADDHRAAAPARDTGDGRCRAERLLRANWAQSARGVEGIDGREIEVPFASWRAFAPAEEKTMRARVERDARPARDGNVVDRDRETAASAGSRTVIVAGGTRGSRRRRRAPRSLHRASTRRARSNRRIALTLRP